MLRSCKIGLLAGLSLASAADAAVLFVKPTPTGAGDCGSWADACSLDDAINSAIPGDEVWVRAGVYGPIELKNGVKIIGGFAGGESLASQSNPYRNVTVVDGGGINRCVYSADHTSATVLRGFNIINGYSKDDQGGGGMLLSGSSALIVQCTFANNTAFYFGGAVAVDYVRGRHYPAQFINCIFRDNGFIMGAPHPVEGGAVFVQTTFARFTNCLFHGNKAGGAGAVAMGPGSNAFFENCTFANNQAAYLRGGAIRGGGVGVNLHKCILWGNTRLEGAPPSPILDQFYYDATVLYSDVEGGWPGTGNINADPLFQDAAGGKFNLQFGSPCKDTASDAYLPADDADLDWDGDVLKSIPYDLALRPRILGFAVDMGAYEAPGCGDGNCEADENPCNCPQDCGPVTESEQVDSTCNDGIDNDCDSLTDCDDPDCGMDIRCMGIVPTVSEWGLVILTLLLLSAAKICFGHRPATALD